MRLEGAIRRTLTGLALAVAACAPARPQAPVAQEVQKSSAASPQQSPLPSSGGISPYEGVVVRKVDFPDVAAEESNHLRDIIAQKEGEPLQRESVRLSIQTLHATGRFADIQVEAERAGDGQVKLAFHTRPNFFVGEIFVEGAPNPPAANQVVNASKLQLGELFVREKLEHALDNVRQLMEQNGYYRSIVSAQDLPHPETQQMDIRFRITPGPQARVGRVTVTGPAGYSAGQIQDIARMHMGDYVSVQLISRALERLRKKYQKQNRLLSQVAISSRNYRLETNSVDYAFEIQPGPKVEINVEGFRISRSQLRKNVPVYEENALDDDLLNEGRRNLLNYIQGLGYFDGKVTVQKNPASAGEMRVTYNIDAGERHKLLKLVITGNKGFSEDQIRSRMQIQPAGRFLAHGRYSQSLLIEDVRNLIANPYRANGFLEVKITPKVEDNYQGKQNDLAITLQIEEGPQTMVGTLQIAGNETALESSFPDLNISPGQGFSYSKINEDREIILNYYFNHGFPNATFEVSAKPSPGDPLLMDVAYTVHLGEQIIVDHVFVSGLHYTRGFVVQREIQIKPGDPLSQIDMLNTQKRLYDLGIFSQVDTAVQNPESSDREKNVLVNVQEAKRYTFNYGLGLEFQTGQPSSNTSKPLGQTGVSPRVSFGVTRLNFRGRNHTVALKANVGGLQQRGLISYDAPRWFNKPNWRLTFTAFYDKTVNVTTFTSQRLEGSVQAEQTLNKTSIMTYRLTYRRVRASDLLKTISPSQIPLLSQPTRVGIPNFSYIRNKRDNDLETTKGNYTTIDGGAADSHFGSETDFGRLLIQNSTYYSIGRKRNSDKKLVLARSTRIGVETPFGNTFMPQPGAECLEPQSGRPACLPLAERFFTGGGNSHRGFGLNQAGPRDPTTGFPLGGTALFVNNVELRMPPPTLPFFQDNISFAIFHDAGNVFTNGHDLFHNLLRWTQKNPGLCQQLATATQCDYSYISHGIGVGVRYKTPVGPVRFDFGYNLNPPAFPRCNAVLTQGQSCQLADFAPQHVGRFNVFFSIGQTF
ncbi:MAG TPA: POTRA domain-containing protein [Terriglobales bacterium]|nr:POTRA domain-containing protein [Terriglobales bacterium]